MKKGWVWPLVPVGVLGFSVCMHITMITKAASDPTIAIEKNAYQRGVRWDEELRQRSINRALAWTIDVEVTDGAKLRARIALPDGKPVRNAMVEIEMFHHARASKIVTRSMADRGDGVYEMELPYRKRGFWRLYFDVKRGDVHFTKTVNHFVKRVPRPMVAR